VRPVNDDTLDETIEFRIHQLSGLVETLHDDGPDAVERSIEDLCPIARGQLLELAVAGLLIVEQHLDAAYPQGGRDE
jgi:hypothetical protein